LFAVRAALIPADDEHRFGHGKAEALAASLEARLATIAEASASRIARPRVYFEEWDAPMISGIGWVSELVEIAGGVDIFSKNRTKQAAKDRIVSSDQVIAAAPEIILASWCGKKVRPERIASRPGWAFLPAVANGRIVEIKSPLILQPGPAALTDGLDAIVAEIAAPRPAGDPAVIQKG
ncbi:MAG: ABC transporter substrate-binding protein, partial [Mesorhizobium sp.]|nr:ABC transporter substrate-binding protein [Mesorhizobium sp.]